MYSHQRRYENYQQLKLLKQECGKLFEWETIQYTDCATVARKSFATLVNSSKYNAADSKNIDSYCSIATNKSPVKGTFSPGPCDYMKKATMQPKSSEQYLNVEAPKDSLRMMPTTTSTKWNTSMLDATNDSRSPHRIDRIWMNIRCAVNQLAELIRPNMYYDATIEQVCIDHSSSLLF